MVKNSSAAKRVQIGLRNNLRNKNHKSSIKTAIKKIFANANIDSHIQQADLTDSSKLGFLVSQAYSKIDKAVKKGVIHKNSAARKKSKIASKIKIRYVS